MTRAGHHDVFVEILRTVTYSKKHRYKYRLFHEHEREDLISEFVIKVHNQIDQFSGSGSYRSQTATFKSWANRIFHGVYVDHCRKKLGRKKTSDKEDQKSSGSSISIAQRNAIMSFCNSKGITEQELEKQIEVTYKSTLDNLSTSEATSLLRNLQYNEPGEPYFKFVSIEEMAEEISNIPVDDNNSKLKDLLDDALTELMKDEKHKEFCNILNDYYEWEKKGLNQKEMAERYGISYDNFRTTLSRARKHLIKAIGMVNG